MKSRNDSPQSKSGGRRTGREVRRELARRSLNYARVLCAVAQELLDESRAATGTARVELGRLAQVAAGMAARESDLVALYLRGRVQ
jgi:hypothetical protein